jgi:hypothetical protein
MDGIESKLPGTDTISGMEDPEMRLLLQVGRKIVALMQM